MIQHLLEDNMVSLKGENEKLDDVTMAYIKIIHHTIGRGGYGLHKEWPFIGRGDYGLHRNHAIGRGGYEISDLGMERTLGTRSLDTDLETSSRAFDRQLLRTLNDPYRKSILFDRLRATYRNSTFTSLYHKYGY